MSVILVTGSRDLGDDGVAVILNALDMNVSKRKDHLLIHGDAPGVDSYLDEVAKYRGWQICAHPADWASYGKAAGPIRNQNMLDHHPDIDLVLAFPAPDSRGTWDMVERAVKARLPVRVYPIP